MFDPEIAYPEGGLYVKVSARKAEIHEGPGWIGCWRVLRNSSDEEAIASGEVEIENTAETARGVAMVAGRSRAVALQN